MIKRDYQLKYLSWPVIKEKIENGYDTAIIVLASTEQHGHHLAECTDETIGLGIACGLAERLNNALVAPPVIPGLSQHHLAFPGSLTLSKDTFKAIIKDYVSCYTRYGFKKFIFIASHGGNMQTTKEMVNELKALYPDNTFINTLSIQFILDLTATFEKKYNLPSRSCGGHACTFETSMMLYFEPDLVNMEKAKAGYMGVQDEEFIEKLFKNGFASVTETGVIGDPKFASVELGEKFYISILDEMEKIIKNNML